MFDIRAGRRPRPHEGRPRNLALAHPDGRQQVPGRGHRLSPRGETPAPRRRARLQGQDPAGRRPPIVGSPRNPPLPHRRRDPSRRSTATRAAAHSRSGIRRRADSSGAGGESSAVRGLRRSEADRSRARQVRGSSHTVPIPPGTAVSPKSRAGSALAGPARSPPVGSPWRACDRAICAQLAARPAVRERDPAAGVPVETTRSAYKGTAGTGDFDTPTSSRRRAFSVTSLLRRTPSDAVITHRYT